MPRNSRFADRGKAAEKEVQKYLTWWESRHLDREFNRLPDTKAAGRTIKAAPADFDFYTAVGASTYFGLIEVKETMHDFRLSRDKITQLPAMRKRSNCGGVCPVLIFHSRINRWRLILAPTFMEFGDKGSWDLSGYPLFISPGEALNFILPQAFEHPG